VSVRRHSDIVLIGARIVGLAMLALAWSGSPLSAQRASQAFRVAWTEVPGSRSAAGATLLHPDTVPAAPVRLFEWRFVGEVALGTAGSLVLLPLDERVRSWMQDPARQESAALDRAAHALLPLGLKRPLIAAAALYGVGLVTGSPTAADIGLHVGEAIAGAGATTIFLKILTGREGPRKGGPYEFGRGDILDPGSRSKAFPSGNTTVAFALAGALTEEASQHWPGTGRWVGPVAFTMATGVAAALMYHNDHWASDVLAGAVVGTLVSRRVVRSLHTGGAGPFSRLDPFLLPRGDGAATAGFSVAFHRGRP
jgi:membrane-associated phospholipid phosphatase